MIHSKGQTFTTPDLQQGHKYKGVVIQKTTYGLFVEIGIHFNWKYGSVVGLLHQSSFREPSSFTNTEEGQELPVTFLGYNKDGKTVLGGVWEKAKWATEEMEAMVGTKQQVFVMVIRGKKTFFVDGMHKARAPITKLWYPDYKDKAKDYIEGLQDGQTIFCEVIKISKKKDCFIIKLPVME